MHIFILTSNILVIMTYHGSEFLKTYLSSLLVLYLLYSFNTSVIDINWFSEYTRRSNSAQNSSGRTSAVASLISDLNYTQVYRSIKQHSATAILLVCCQWDNIQRSYHTLMIHFFNIIQTVTRKMSTAISENSIIAPSHFLFFQLLNLLINDWLQYCEQQPP